MIDPTWTSAGANAPSDFSGTSGAQSQSTSESYIPDYPQSSFLMSVAQQAKDMAGQMAAWGKDAYNSGKGLTDQIINEGKMFASPGRIKQDMGMAEAGVAQAGEAGRQNALRDLQSYGIDPSSGRYAALDKAERSQTAAQQAGAGNLQRMRTEDVGRQMRMKGTEMSLQNEAIGANLMRIPNDYLNTASSLKYPPLGNKSQSSAQRQGAGGGSSGGGGGRQGGGGGSSGGSSGGGGGGQGSDHANTGGGSGYNGMGTGNAGKSSMQSAGGKQQGSPGPKAISVGPWGEEEEQYGQYGSDSLDYTDPNYDPYSAYDPSGSTWGTTGQDTGYDLDAGTYETGGQYDPNAGSSWNGNWGDSGGGGGGDYYGASGSDYSADTGGYNEDYAAGGGVDEGMDSGPTTGGFVPDDASPSAGEETDDVPANLNAGEFVIPRDVALWKGQEFFQKLIAQSRKNRVTAPAHGEPSDKPPQQPTFQSSAMG